MPSEIRLQSTQWPQLEVTRDGKLWLIEKPRVSVEPLVALKFTEGRAPIRAEELPGMVRLARTSFIGIECEEPALPEANALVFSALVTLASDLLAWIRVYSGQYWVGYKESDVTQRHLTMGVVEGGIWKEKPTPVGFGLSFPYGRPLDATMWQAIGKKLARGERPAPARLYFCDALGEMLENDVTQAVVALGISCELEVQTLIDELIAKQAPPFRKLFDDYVRCPFPKSIGTLIRDLGGDPFDDSEPEAAKLVRTLYSMRGQAVHSGQCTYEENGISVSLDVHTLLKFVRAIEKLFAWTDSQRLKLAN